MNIIKIGEQYVNMDNVVTFEVRHNVNRADNFEFYGVGSNGLIISIGITEQEANILRSEFRKNLLLSSVIEKNKTIFCVDCRYGFLANIDDCTLIGDTYWCRCPKCRGLNKFEEEE